MKIKRFEDIEAWENAKNLCIKIFNIFNKDLEKKEKILPEQIKRASISTMANIAEGFFRKNNKEFVQFLFISKSFAAEVQSHLHIVFEIGIIDNKTFELYNISEIIPKTNFNLN